MHLRRLGGVACAAWIPLRDHRRSPTLDDARRAAARALRLRRASAPGQERAVEAVLAGPRHARRAADRRRQVALLPGAGAAAARAHRRRVAAHLADEGPGRRARRARPPGGVHQQHAHARRRSAERLAARRRAARSSCSTSRPSASTSATPPSGCATWASRSSRSTRRTASASGATTSGRATCACAACASGSATRRRSRSPRPPRREVRRGHRAPARAAATRARSSPASTGTNLHYHVVPTQNDAEKDAALVDIAARRTKGMAIVYASTRRHVERITGVLRARADLRPRRITPGSTTRTATRCRTRS